MTLSIYVDGSGGTNSGYGFFVNETGESFYENKSDITNNQAEYMAIISALKKYEKLTNTRFVNERPKVSKKSPLNLV